MSRFLFPSILFAALFACSDKDDGATPEGDADTDTDADSDTDSDTDADTDTDTDTDSDTDLSGTIEFRAGNHNNPNACETTIELAGTPYSGDCPSCDFAFAVTGKVTAEEGTSCDYDAYPPSATFLATSTIPNVYLAFSSSTTDGYANVLRAGFAYDSKKGPYWRSYVYDGGTDGSATHSADLLEWTLEYTQFGDSLATIDSCGGPYVGEAGTSDYGGAYVAYGEWSRCQTLPYDLWSFTARQNEIVYISVDTTSPTTAVDTQIYVMDAASCYLGDADDSFECSFSPERGSCPSYALPVVSGDEYLVLVHSFGGCASAMGEYKLAIEQTGDPSLTLVASEQPTFEFQRIHVEGSANIP